MFGTLLFFFFLDSPRQITFNIYPDDVLHDTMSLYCEADANPAAEYRWQRDGVDYRSGR